MVTVTDVKLLMMEREIGMLEAKKILVRAELLRDIEKAQSVSDLKDILIRVLNNE